MVYKSVRLLSCRTIKMSDYRYATGKLWNSQKCCNSHNLPKNLIPEINYCQISREFWLVIYLEMTQQTNWLHTSTWSQGILFSFWIIIIFYIKHLNRLSAFFILKGDIYHCKFFYILLAMNCKELGVYVFNYNQSIKYFSCASCKAGKPTNLFLLM